MILILGIQIFIILVLTLDLLYNFIENRKLKSKIETIDKDNKEKYVYYRDLLNDLSIAEIGFLYSGKRKLNLLVIATLKKLEYKNKINLENKNDLTNLTEEEKYIVEKYKFVGTKEFNENCCRLITENLEKKGYVKPIEKVDVFGTIVIFTIIYMITFVALFMIESKTNIYGIIAAILFLLYWLVGMLYLFYFQSVYDANMNYEKTEKGTEVYLKILALKRFLKDFGEFEDKEWEEIKLWEDYLLYAIVLDETDKIEKNLNKEYSYLLENKGK